MPSRWVVHAATMELGGPTGADVIRRATASTLARADALGARSLALVAFGTGVGGFPLDDAARIEVEEVRRHLAAGSGLERVVFAVHGERARQAFQAAVDAAAMTDLATAVADAGGAGAPPTATAGLRRDLVAELGHGRAELGRTRSGYGRP
jgi:hypothetical protein